MQAVEVSVHKIKDIILADAGSFSVHPRMRVLVEEGRGVNAGLVVSAPKSLEENSHSLPKILRILTTRDLNRLAFLEKKVAMAVSTCQAFAKELNLPIKIIAGEYTLDTTRLIFYFISEERVDFRELVRRLAGIYKRRIEMRQIGPRDVTRICGGIGSCGRPTCCSSHLRDFEKVSGEMAEAQFLPATSSKILGLCGLLKCCLRYEYPAYSAIGLLLPPMGGKVLSPKGEGLVIGVDVYNEIATLKILGSTEVVKFPFHELSRPFQGGCGGCAARTN